MVSPTLVRAQEMTLQLDSEATRISFTLEDVLHTVHGTFQMRSGLVHFNTASGAASGEILVDATTGNTGNKTRDRKMHREILQSDRFPEATFRPSRVSGTIPGDGAGTVEVQGVFRLHGADHPLTLSVPVQVNGNTLTANVHMTIPYVAWGLKNPSNFLLRVSDKVTLDIVALGHLSPGTAASQ